MMFSAIRLLTTYVFFDSLFLVHASIVTYDFNITWVNANPDGAFERPVIGINGQWPVPRMTATVGDQVVVNVINQLVNESTSLHFHGIYQNGSTEMDGPGGVSQCPIPPGASLTYKFTIDQPGTYWYHSHTAGQYPDGLRGPLIVHDPQFPYEYDEELVLTLSDWYHQQVPTLLASFMNVANPTGAEPIPDSALMNDTQNLSVPVQPATTYLIRILNVGAFAGQYLWFEGHTMQIIEVDGIYTEQAEAEMLYLTAAQRYSILLTTMNDTSTNFAISASMDTVMFDHEVPGLNPNVTGWLVYDESKPLPAPVIVNDWYAFDDFTLIPHDGELLLADVDHQIILNFNMGNLDNGENYAFFNGQTYVSPVVPTLYTVLTSGDAAGNVTIYGSNTNSFVLQKDEVVELVVNSDDPGKHPFHLHGHAFQAVWRSEDGAGAYANNVSLAPVPMRRDTFMVNPNGNIVLRFKANNPGVWLFHCHIEWHVSSGLMATMIEAPTEVQKIISIPPEHLQICNDQNIPTAGNAAGNTVDLFDLSGENLPPSPLPAGFTDRGIVALVFSCVSAILGLMVITWYGVGEISANKVTASRNIAAQIGGAGLRSQ